MRTFQVVLGVAFGVLVFLFLDYVLPSRDTVRITNTYNKLTDVGWNRIFYAAADTGTVENIQGQRDIRFIDTVRPNGRPLVYRNEDTGTIWPPYFKYDSSNLHAIAGDRKSTSADPEWVNITSYGWRISFLSIYPNAISIRSVAGPADNPANWPAMVILGVLGALLFLFWRMWNQFRERSIDPMMSRADRALDRADARMDSARDRVAAQTRQARGRFSGWLGSWRGKPRR
ncbi:DUF1523 family protein [Paracoccus luteus]|uniref:DUF1523 family protein n=1 Tax=Paracoccus luteus TaxID=2508543 RepID=UPI00106F5A85|nr:DUF1523 family protein [Paracoccus luteus]